MEASFEATSTKARKGTGFLLPKCFESLDALISLSKPYNNFVEYGAKRPNIALQRNCKDFILVSRLYPRSLRCTWIRVNEALLACRLYIQ